MGLEMGRREGWKSLRAILRRHPGFTLASLINSGDVALLPHVCGGARQLHRERCQQGRSDRADESTDFTVAGSSESTDFTVAGSSECRDVENPSEFQRACRCAHQWVHQNLPGGRRRGGLDWHTVSRSTIEYERSINSGVRLQNGQSLHDRYGFRDGFGLPVVKCNKWALPEGGRSNTYCRLVDVKRRAQGWTRNALNDINGIKGGSCAPDGLDKGGPGPSYCSLQQQMMETDFVRDGMSESFLHGFLEGCSGVLGGGRAGMRNNKMEMTTDKGVLDWTRGFKGWGIGSLRGFRGIGGRSTCCSPASRAGSASSSSSGALAVDYKFDLDEATKRFAEVIGGHWLGPMQPLGDAAGLMVRSAFQPFWIFDAVVATRISGLAGFDTPEHYYNLRTRRIERRTRTVWKLTGTHDKRKKYSSEESVMQVYGAYRYPSGYMNGLRGEIVTASQPLTASMLANRELDPFKMRRETAWHRVRERVRTEEVKACTSWLREMYGADKISNVNAQVVFEEVNARAVFLPAYIVEYVHFGIPFRAVVSGATGDVIGEKQYSRAKLGALAAALMTAGTACLDVVRFGELHVGGVGWAVFVAFVSSLVAVGARWLPRLLATWRLWRGAREGGAATEAEEEAEDERERSQKMESERAYRMWRFYEMPSSRRTGGSSGPGWEDVVREFQRRFEAEFQREWGGFPRGSPGGFPGRFPGGSPGGFKGWSWGGWPGGQEQQQQYQQQQYQQQQYQQQQYQQQQQQQQHGGQERHEGPRWGGGRAWQGVGGDQMGYYAELGLSAKLRNASQEEIKTAFRRLALEWHPDKHADPASRTRAQEKFKKISHAYQILRDPVKRARYDSGEPVA